MSKLSAVTTGQPTQGIGAAPTTRAVPRLAPTQQHPSPLHAQRAEAEAAGVDFDDLDPALAAPAAINPRSAPSAAAATVPAAWLSLSATEMEVRK